MKGRFKGFLVLLLSLTILLGSTMTAFAGSTANGAFNELMTAIVSGDPGVVSPESPYYKYFNGTTTVPQQKTYKCSGGGYALYTELVVNDASIIVNEQTYQTLTAKSKQKFITDLLLIAQAKAWEGENNALGTTSNQVTSETVSDLMTILQDRSGMGSTLMASLLANTKPDYVTANKIYAPFSGVIGTVLALISIFIMALLGVTMALDIAYITIPAFQLLLDGDSDGGGQNGGGTKGMAKIVSAAARNAVKAADGDSGGQAGSGNKMALGVYFKYRWKELIVLGICLLYLVQGQIYNFVAWILDLVSGFLGF